MLCSFETLGPWGGVNIFCMCDRRESYGVKMTDCGRKKVLPLLDLLHPNFQKLNITLYSKIMNINLHIKGCDFVKDI